MARDVSQARECFPVARALDGVRSDDMPGARTRPWIGPKKPGVHKPGVERVSCAYLVAHVDETQRRHDRAVVDRAALTDADHDTARASGTHTLFECLGIARAPQRAGLIHAAEIPVHERQDAFLRAARLGDARPECGTVVRIER